MHLQGWDQAPEVDAGSQKCIAAEPSRSPVFILEILTANPYRRINFQRPAWRNPPNTPCPHPSRSDTCCHADDTLNGLLVAQNNETK